MGNSVATDIDITDAPAHTVTVSAFYMAKNLVSKADWDTVRTWAISNGYTDLVAGSGKASTHPVQSMEWFQMVKYCNARSQMEGLTPVYYINDAQTTVYKTGGWSGPNEQVKWTANGYRLPTEAEWEKAARGGLSGKRFPWGDTINENQANYRASSYYSFDLSGAINNYNLTYYTAGWWPYTSPVGAFAANGYGLHDMAGNVEQRCWDCYGTYDTGSPTDPRGVSSGVGRVTRGGAYYDYAFTCSVARRYSTHPQSISDGMGFRVARSSLGAAAVTSDSISNASMDMRDAVNLTNQPTNATANPGASASFNVTAVGGGPYSFQWKKNGVAIAGATAATLSLSAVGIVEEGIYSCVVTNAYGTVESAGGRLTATVLAGSPDTDGDGLSDSLEKYLAGLGLGFDPATDSADALARLKAIVPLLGDFYSSDQMHGLALGQAVLEPQAGGKFRLSLGLEESADLSTWTPKAVSAGDVTITSGKLGVDIQPASVKTKFYRLQGKP